MRFSVFFLIALCMLSCSKDRADSNEHSNHLFKKISETDSGIAFKNILTENDSLNYFTYTSIYMGGGVAVGDIDNDGLKDLFFLGNQVDNTLYLNKGNLKFEDVTLKAKVNGDKRWYSGVSMADVNADGYLDIYCSVSGLSGLKENQLYINNGDQTFTEKAKELGLADAGNTVQSTFFDYDNDGDLDVYLVNYPIANINKPLTVFKQRVNNPKLATSDKLYRNDGGSFTDVSTESGILNYGFGLSATVADLNNDGWLDIYVSNDFSIPDFLYINKGDGTFKEVMKEATSQTSFYGMGVDIADINNDNYLDIFQVDMDADDNRRQKANMASMNTSFFSQLIMNGFHHQYMHNCLQLNTGVVKDSVPKFSNISRLAGVSSTDWSWGPLFADFDNDGYKDLFVTNGSRREVMNKDFFIHINKQENRSLTNLDKVSMLPVEKIDNYIYRNNGELGFERKNQEWGIEYKGFSNGATYADLDNDGDLEIVINNLDDFASIYENTSASASNYIQFAFEGFTKNTFGIGARVYLKMGEESQMQELMLSRGFQSSVSPELHFGIGKHKNIDEVKVVWPNGNVQMLKNIPANQKLKLSYANSSEENIEIAQSKSTFFNSDINSFSNIHLHKENSYDDFRDQVLLPHKMSEFGPALAVADFNGDGLDDFFVGGAKGFESSIYIQGDNDFNKTVQDVFIKDKNSEDVGALAFDADLDGDKDLYVVSGGYEYLPNSKSLQDRLYINDGKGNFSKAQNAVLPKKLSSGSKAYSADFDKDGKQDVLVLGRQIPKHYPASADTFILKNTSDNGVVKFEDVTLKWANDFFNLGMATCAVITDYNNDDWLDIIIVGEWMPIRVFKNVKNGFTEVSKELGLTKDTMGWWWSINQGDFDNDGDMDYILGNNGLNYKYKATDKETFDMYINDFDNNNNTDIVLSYYNGGKQYPLRGRQCSSQQIPAIKSKFKDYNSFSTATLEDVYSKKSLESSTHYQIKSFASIYIENDNGKFKIKKLPIEAQFSAVNQILVEDFNNDGHLDAVIAGNLYASEIETPRNDAGHGLYLKGNTKGDFSAVSPKESGFHAFGNVKDMIKIKVKANDYIIVAKNNDALQFIKVNTPEE